MTKTLKTILVCALAALLGTFAASAGAAVFTTPILSFVFVRPSGKAAQKCVLEFFEKFL